MTGGGQMFGLGSRSTRHAPSRIFSARALMKISEACFGHAVGYLSIY
jgi:hypothetical protein